MPTGNPLEQLRRRMQSHATPAAFAALAEEHRRAGRFAEAIAVCRDGLERYPAYVSARVTLGRALLDSGDAVMAVTELQQAVAQAPDNLAARRALDAARAACADLPDLPPPPPLDDLTLHRAAVADADPLVAAGDFPSEHDPVALPPIPDLPFPDLPGGADGPQEFGLRDDWTLPDLPAGATPANSWEAPAPAADDPSDGPQTQALAAHADAPTMYFTPPPLQGEEPAGIWPVPVTTDGQAAARFTEAAPVYSWGPDVPVPTSDGAIDVSDPARDHQAVSVWDEPTGEAARPGVEAAAAAPAVAEPAPAVWTGLFEEPVGDGAEPASFAGWDAPGPSAPEKPSWGSEDVAASDSGMWSAPASTADEPGLAPGASTFTWGEPVAAECVAAAATIGLEGDQLALISDVLPVDAAANGASAEIACDWSAPELVAADEEWAGVEAAVLVPAPGAAGAVDAAAEALVSDATWAGSVASALDEVFRQAGRPHAAAAAVEPPAPADDPHRRAMADTAVDAALEDASRRDDTAIPALASLQQMLDAVRARRAALFTDVKH